MGLYGMMRTGVSGMNAQASRLGTVSDNIANADTTGYKRASTEFSSMVMPSAAGTYNSGGVEADVRYAITDPGVFRYTTSDTDLAIDGNGFFYVQDQNGQQVLTRAGSFEPISQTDPVTKKSVVHLVNAAGMTLLATDPNGNLVPVEFPPTRKPSSTPTTAAGMAANLPSNAANGTQLTTSLAVYDSQGNERLLNFTYEKIDDNKWNLTVTQDGTPILNGAAGVELDFDTNGALTSSGTLPATTALNIGGAVLDSIDIDITGTTQLNYQFSISDPEKSGKPASDFSGYEISADGSISAKYENGNVEDLYRIPLANVQSPDSLTPLPGNVYVQNNETGDVTLGYPGSGSFGSILTDTLEGSNVDLGEQLTEMISAQRSYTANSKVFQTGSDLLNILVNLQR